MKIIINCSNLYIGGGVQVAVSIINELKILNNNHQYHIFLSPVISKQVNPIAFPANIKFYLIEKSPTSLKTRRIIVRQLQILEDQIQPDIVLSIFGPVYWRPKVKHIMGFALSFLIKPDSIAYSRLSFFEQWQLRSINFYKKYYVKRDSDYYITETEDTKQGLIDILKISANNVFVIGNTYNSYFDLPASDHFQMPEREPNEFRFITVSHYYSHKNLRILNKVIPLLSNELIRYKFYLTIDPDNYRRYFSRNTNHIINLGPIESRHCPSVYKQCDALFLPTLIESFTASYPEAMKMQIPIVTSDYPFAKEICRNAALYFDPLNPDEIASKIKEISNNDPLRIKLVANGTEVLHSFENARSRAAKYIGLCEALG